MSRPPPDPLHILHSSNGSVTALTVIKYGDDEQERLVSGTLNGHITIWDLKALRAAHTWEAHSTKILWLAFDLTSKHLVSQGRGDALKFWTAEGTLSSQHSIDHDGFCQGDIKNNMVAVPSGKSGINILDISQKPQIKTAYTLTPATDEGAVTTLKFVNNQDAIIAGYESGYVCKWASNQVESEVRMKGMPICVDVNTIRQEILVGSSSESVHVFDLKNLTLKHQIGLTNAGLNCVSLRHDGKVYATGGWDHRIRLFSGKSHRKLCVLQLHDQPVTCLAFTCSEVRIGPAASGFRVLAAGCNDAQISLWNLYNDV